MNRKATALDVAELGGCLAQRCVARAQRAG